MRFLRRLESAKSVGDVAAAAKKEADEVEADQLDRRKRRERALLVEMWRMYLVDPSNPCPRYRTSVGLDTLSEDYLQGFADAVDATRLGRLVA